MNAGAWLTRHAQNAVGSLGTLWRNPIASTLTVFVIGIALSLPAALNVLVQSGRAAAGNLTDIRDFSVYMAPGVERSRAEELARTLRADPSVAKVDLIGADDALAELRADPAWSTALEALDTNPLPHTLVVRPADSATPADVQRVADEARTKPGVDLVKLDSDWLLRLHAILDFVRRAVLIAGLLLAVAVVVIVGNTIRLDIQNRSAEIEVAKLLGATDGFVRRPFLYLGLWYGLLGGTVAVLILAAGLWALSEPLGRLAGLYGSDAGLAGPGGATVLAVFGGGIAAGLLGAWTAVARHLSAIQPRV